MSAVFMTACGALNETDRAARMTKLQGIIGDAASDFVFGDFINTQSEVFEFKHNGFPSDELSLENVQILNQSETRTLFVIDRAEHIVEWLEHSLGGARRSCRCRTRVSSIR
jgi:hypothetical protein